MEGPQPGGTAAGARHFEKEIVVKRKIEKKLSLNRETLRSLDATSLTGVVGGSKGTDKTNGCSVCLACTSSTRPAYSTRRGSAAKPLSVRPPLCRGGRTFVPPSTR